MIKIPYMPFRSSLLICVVLILSAVAAVLITPNYKPLNSPYVLEEVIPRQFGEWKQQPDVFAQVSTSPTLQALSDSLYNQVLTRTYKDGSGNQIMLAIAFAEEQRQEVKIHEPEVCYPAQGYEILSLNTCVFKLFGNVFPINGKQLLFKKDDRIEAVTYWIRVGSFYPTSGLQMRIKILKDGLKGKVDDGVLFRVSTIINQESDAAAAYKQHEEFILALLQPVELSAPGLLVIKPPEIHH